MIRPTDEYVDSFHFFEEVAHETRMPSEVQRVLRSLMIAAKVEGLRDGLGILGRNVDQCTQEQAAEAICKTALEVEAKAARLAEMALKGMP